MHRWQESAPPKALPGARCLVAADQHDETGQVLVLSTQTVGRPSPHRGGAQTCAARVQKQLCGRVVEFPRRHRADDRCLVRDLREMREQLADPSSGPTGPGEAVRRAQHLRNPFDEGEALSFEEVLGAVGSVVLLKFRFGIEELKLGWPARHVQIDDRLRLCGKMRFLGGQPPLAALSCGPKRPQVHRRQAELTPAKEVSARGPLDEFGLYCHMLIALSAPRLG